MSERQRQPSFMIPDAVPGDPKQIQAVQSIRNTRDSRNVDASPAGVEQQLVQQEDFWRDATTPERIMELKSEYDDRVKRSADESRFSFDKRAGVQHGDRERVKGDVIDRYLQSGADPKNPRKIPSGLRTNVSNLMNMSYDQLQELADKQSARRNANKPALRTLPGATVEPTAPKPADEPVADAYPELGLSDDERMRQRLADILKIKDPELREDALNHFRERVGDEQADAFGVPPRTVPPTPAQGGRGEPPEPPEPPQPPVPGAETVYEASQESKEAQARLETLRDQLVLMAAQRRARVLSIFRRGENRELNELRSQYDDAVRNYLSLHMGELERAGVSEEERTAQSWVELFKERDGLAVNMAQAEEAVNSEAEHGNRLMAIGSRVATTARRLLRRVMGVQNSRNAIRRRADTFGSTYDPYVQYPEGYELGHAEADQTNAVVRGNLYRLGRNAVAATAGALLLVGGDQLAVHQAAKQAATTAGHAAPVHPPATPLVPSAPVEAAPQPDPWHVNQGEWIWNALARDPNVGPANAEAYLHHLTDVAAAHGHDIAWHVNPNGTEYPSVDGVSDPQTVLDKLVEFRNS